MRQILVAHAKRQQAVKRGSGNKVALDEADGAIQKQAPADLIAESWSCAFRRPDRG